MLKRAKPTKKRLKRSLFFVSLLFIFSALCFAQDKRLAELVWVDLNEGEYQLKMSEYLGENEWSEEVLLYSSDNPLTSPAIATSPEGSKLVVWTEQNRSKTILKSISSSLDSTWGEPSIFSDQGFENFSASIVYDISGKAWVFWSSTVSELSDIYLVRSEGFNWSLPMRVNSKNNVPDLHPQASLTNTGEVEIKWTRYSFENKSYIADSYIFDIEAEQRSEIELVDSVALNDIPLPNFLPQGRLSVMHFPRNQMLQSLPISWD